jgi:uncharacterized membrane protein HdeD (DUF308 family)
MATAHTLQPPLGGPVMLHTLARNWWLILLRGIAAIVFGVLTFIWPGITLLTLIAFYAAFAFIDGVLALWAAIAGGQPGPRWWLAIVGLLGIAVGLLTLFMPGVTALVLLFFIAAWSIIIGIMQIIGAIRLRKEIDNEWWLVASGALSVLFGLVLIVFPGAGALGLLYVIGAYAVIYGAMLVALALRLKKHSHAPG